MLKAVHRNDAAIYHLPGRDWLLCVGPENTAARNLTLGVAVFPAGSAPDGHVHDTQEEVIHVTSGSARRDGAAAGGNIGLHPGRPAPCHCFARTRAAGAHLRLFPARDPRIV